MRNKQVEQQRTIRRFVPYIFALVAVVALVFVGSIDKTDDRSSAMNMNALAEGNYAVSTDQLSEFYVVANLSNTMNLASTETVSSNYVTVSVMKDIGQASSGKLEKPNIVNTSGISRGIINYTVKEGETMASIAMKLGLTKDQIRWSNNLKDEEVMPGQVLVLPSVPGIVYVVKEGDTTESLAEKYKSLVEGIVTVNDLEGSGLTVGAQIVLPGGVLPVTERPEYVPPVTERSRTSSYTYFGSTSDRINLHTISEAVSSIGGNPMTPGQCTWYAWWWRYTHGMPLPGGSVLGNAWNWASAASAAGYLVNRTPAYGAVFQTTAGYYGHVGIVTGVNPDGSITVREMNYNFRAFVVTESVVPANIVSNFYYIH